MKLAYQEGRKISNKGITSPLKGIATNREPTNKILFTEEQKNAIAADTRSCRAIGKDYGVGGHIIVSLKKSMGISLQKGNTGKKHSEETKQKMAEKKIGKYTGEDNPFYGRSHSEETIEKNRAAHSGKQMSDETKEKIKQSNIGKHFGKQK